MKAAQQLALVDTSAWIDVLRASAESTLRTTVAELLEDGVAGMCPPIWVELYAGVKGKAELQRLSALRGLCRWYAIDEACWELSAELSRACREGGLCIPFSDVVIYACAQQHKLTLIEKDRHFGMLGKIQTRNA